MIQFFVVYGSIIFVALCLLVFLLLRAERRTGLEPSPSSKSTPLGSMTYRQVRLLQESLFLMSEESKRAPGNTTTRGNQSEDRHQEDR